MYELVEELEKMFPGRHFTPDGHTVGSIGESIAAHYYGLELLTASNKGYDAVIENLSVEIKATQGKSIGIRHKPERLLVLELHRDGSWDEVYNGPGSLVWAKVSQKPLPSNGQYQISCSKLRKLMSDVPQNLRLSQIVDRVSGMNGNY